VKSLALEIRGEKLV